MKKLDDRSIEEQINKRIKSEKANTVFLKLYPKFKGKRPWNSILNKIYSCNVENPSGIKWETIFVMNGRTNIFSYIKMNFYGVSFYKYNGVIE